MKKLIGMLSDAFKETSLLIDFTIIGVLEIVIYFVLTSITKIPIWWIVFWVIYTLISIYYGLKFNIFLIEMVKYNLKKVEKLQNKYKEDGNEIMSKYYVSVITNYRNVISFLRIES